MACKRKTCLFGGSFDPVHSGHLHIAAAAQKCCRLDEVIFLPAACSPFKQNNRTLFRDDDRMELLRLALTGLPWAHVSDLDLILPPPSWSWRLVEHFSAQNPQAELYWLLGTDQWEQLHRWARYDYLAEHLTFIVYHRGAAPTPRPGVRSHFISGQHPASSTIIREALRNNSPLPDGWMPEQVECYARACHNAHNDRT